LFFDAQFLSQKLYIHEIGENIIKIIDPAIVLKPAHASCKKVIQVNLLVFSMSKRRFISFRDPFDVADDAFYNWLCYNGLYLF